MPLPSYMRFGLRSACVWRQRLKRADIEPADDKRIRERRKVQQITNMMRWRGTPAVVNPLCATALSGDGETYVTAPLVSPGVYAIRPNDGVFQTPSKSTASFRIEVEPETPLTTLAAIRIDGGIQGTTRGAHELDGDNWSLAQGPDPFTYEVLASTFDANSTFGYGHCYVDKSALIDAAGPLHDLSAWARGHGPGGIKLPLGGMYVQSKTARFPEAWSVLGHGGRRTFFFLADSQDQPAFPYRVNHVVGTGTDTPLDPDYRNVSDTYWEGFTVFGNRGHQVYGAGQHAVDVGADDDTGVAISIKWRDVHVVGSAGYGTSLGGHNGKMHCEFIECTWQWTDGDNFDCKNRLNENDDILWRDCVWGRHAMGSQGTNLAGGVLPNSKPLITLSANAFTTTGAGQSTVTISRSIDKVTIVGEVVTITLAGTVDGINLNASARVTAVDSSHITLDYAPQVATEGGVAGGAAGAKAFIPHISIGDCIVDCRGHRFRVLGAVADSEFFARNGFRQRGGLVTDPNGEGGTDLMFRDLHGVDHTASWIVDTNSEGRGFVTILGIGASVSGVRFTSNASANGFAIGAQSERYSISDFQITGGAIGIQCRGNRGRFVNGLLINQTSKGIEVFGGTVTGGIDLPDDPLSPVALGSAQILVKAPAHGKNPSASVGFSNVVQGNNNLTVEGSNTHTYSIDSVPDPDHYNVTVSGSNTDATLSAYGGDGVQAVYSSNTPNTAYDNTFIGVTTRQDNSNTAIGWSIGHSGALAGRASGTRIMACFDDGSNTPYEDAGSNTDWAGLNRNLPNNGVFDTITASGLVSANYRLVGSGNTATGVYDFATDGATASIEFHGLAPQGEVLLAVFGLTHGSGTSRNWQVQVSQDNATWKNTSGDYARSGVSAGTDSLVFCGSVAAATPASGLIQIFMFSSAIKHAVRINGGADNATTGAQSQMGYVTAAAALQAVRIVNSGGVNTTGGTVYCLGKA